MTSHGSAGVRPSTEQEEVSGESPPTPALPLRLPDLDPRYVAGCALVARMGSPMEIAVMEGNRAEVQQMNRNTRLWMARRQRRAA